MARDIAIVLNNGSLPSAVATTLAAQKYRPILVFGQAARGADGARRAYEQQLAFFKPYREHTIPLDYGATAKADLTPSAADPRQTAPLAPQLLELMPLIASAAHLAAHYQAATVYLGLSVAPDHLAQATEFFQIWNEMIQLPCGQGELEVVAPLLELELWQIVDLGVQVSAPLERTWSCQGENAEPCFSCRACRAREAAFIQAAKPDPIKAKRN